MLDIDNLLNDEYIQSKVPGLTKAIAANLHEASLVCLQHNEHSSGVSLILEGTLAPGQPLPLVWSHPLPNNAFLAHADFQESTEDGAAALGILLVTEFTEYELLACAPKGNGFDYFLIKKDNAINRNRFNFLSSAHHLEVSGILKESKTNTRNQRLKDKRQRFQKLGTVGKHIIIIVAFDTPAATMEIS